MMRRKAQSITEYAIFIAAVILAFLAIKAYLARGYSGYAKKYTDSLGKNSYSPVYSNYTQIKETANFVNPDGAAYMDIDKGLQLTDAQKIELGYLYTTLNSTYTAYLEAVNAWSLVNNTANQAAVVSARNSYQSARDDVNAQLAKKFQGSNYTLTNSTDDQVTRTIAGTVDETALSKETAVDTSGGFSSLENNINAADVSDTDFPQYKAFKNNFDNLPVNYTVSKTGNVVDDFSGEKLGDDQLFSN